MLCLHVFVISHVVGMLAGVLRREPRNDKGVARKALNTLHSFPFLSSCALAMRCGLPCSGLVDGSDDLPGVVQSDQVLQGGEAEETQPEACNRGVP